jgi:hypothetical protein
MSRGPPRFGGGDLARAREAAIREAQQKAIRQVLADILKVGDPAGLPREIKSLLSRPDRYVDTYSVLQEGPEADAYDVRLRVAVMTDFLVRDLDETGIRREGLSNPRLHPVLVRIRGVRDLPQFVRVRTELSGLPGVRHVLPRQVSPGLILLDMETSEPAVRLAEQIRSLACFVIRGEGETPGRLEIEFRP